MHRSRLTAIGIDVPPPHADAAAAFWAGALGAEAKRPDDPDDPYVDLGRDPHHGLEIFVQAVGETLPRLHLDIETDDVEAETTRLEALGAQRVEFVQNWWIMRDPVGMVFCVVPTQPGDFPAGARDWP